ncbi:hypothetical protein ACDX78_12255 [Virgibacillus oceani]
MAQSLNSISRADIRGTAVGVLFMAFFGTMWAYAGIIGLQGWGSPWVLIASLAIGIALFASGCLLIFASRELPNQVPYAAGKRGKNIGGWFNTIFLAEGFAIVIAIVVCNAAGQTELIPLVIALIVGIHFFPLAYLFQVRIYYYTGTLLCLLPVITWIIVPYNVTLMEQRVNAYMSVVGFGSSSILWGTSLVIYLMGRKLIRLASNEKKDVAAYP